MFTPEQIIKAHDEYWTIQKEYIKTKKKKTIVEELLDYIKNDKITSHRQVRLSIIRYWIVKLKCFPDDYQLRKYTNTVYIQALRTHNNTPLDRLVEIADKLISQ